MNKSTMIGAIHLGLKRPSFLASLDKKAEVEKSPSDPLKKQLQIAEENYYSFAKRWIGLSMCYANMVALSQRFFGGPFLYMGCHLSLDNFEVIKIGADRANEYCKSIKKTTVLLAGDASSTVDPTTGLGCNTAIQSAVDFLDFIWDYDAKVPQANLLEDYSSRTNKRVHYIHEKSKLTRSFYRPDALLPDSMFMNMT